MKFLITTLLSTAIFSAYAQQNISGKVVDAETKKPIKDAEVTIDGTETSTKTNFLGFFQLAVDTSQTLKITSAGYETGKIKIPDNMSAIQIGLTKLEGHKDDEMIFTVVEQQAQFPGGLGGLFEHIQKNLKYPKDARDNRITGKVMVEFVVDRAGEIPPNEIKVTQSLYPSCDEEALRLIKSFPKWTPGMQNGKPVKSKFVIPISFKDP
jgi:TonB family protein